jgi:hypothetical protein
MEQRAQEALNETAALLFGVKFPQVASLTEVEVRYFGGGNKFEARRRKDGRFHVVCYIHENATDGLPALIQRAGKLVQELTQTKVFVRQELLGKLHRHVPAGILTEEETAEIQAALAK